MALTAYPVVSFSPATGSDTAASGAGPATAVTGTCNAVANSTTIPFAGAPDLSGVAQDGSHVLWIDGVGFVRISTVDNVAKSVVVETALTVGSGTTFAIGGKRALWNSTESARLFGPTTSPTASGLGPGWEVTSDGDQTSATTMLIGPSGMTTVGEVPFTMRGENGLIQVSCSGSGVAVITWNSPLRARLQNIQIRHTHPTTKGIGLTQNNFSVFVELRDSIVGSADGVNCPTVGIFRAAGSLGILLVNSSVLRCSSDGISGARGPLAMYYGEVSRCGGRGIFDAWNFQIHKSIISHNTLAGISTTMPQDGLNSVITDTTIHGNGGDGITFLSGTARFQFFRLLNNQVTKNGGYGLNFLGAGTSKGLIEGNNFGNAVDQTANSSGAVFGTTLPASNTTDPVWYADPSAAVRNFVIADTAKGGAYLAPPATIGAGQTATTTNTDRGAGTKLPATGGFVIGG